MAFASPEKCAPSKGVRPLCAKAREAAQTKKKKMTDATKAGANVDRQSVDRRIGAPMERRASRPSSENTRASTSVAIRGDVTPEETLETSGKMYGSNDDWRNGRPQEPNSP